MAIDEILDEHEQSRRVQEWLRRNGGGLIGGVLLGLAAVGGWKWWQQREAQAQMRQADTFQTAVDAIDRDGVKAAGRVQALPAGIYRSLAALRLAKAQAEAKDDAGAIATLQRSMPSDTALAAIFRRRIARLQIDSGKAADALKSLDATDAASLDLRGDAQFVLGQVDAARDSYRKALAKTDVGSPDRRLIELKYTQVGGVPAQPQTP
ncbi:YfgM family protein [Cognatilysobacter lacus]|uniref:Ancillary SecYEG translocon subunit n=1 Tax=Cognatilysobacter lacus TaxID=1643323 RepID=A0A5D8Z9R1_9GAMM|nr:tetratricopeptide repeat protein [Lysobacter lacus]TZF91397.1 tetratricopeptide repeat protein [Lysobacter lacus]